MSADALGRFVLALRTRDSVASAGLEREARAHLARFCLGYLGDADGAEDAAQETLARAALAASAGDTRAWILAIARNHCLDVLRARAARPDAVRLATGFDAARDTAGPITRMVGGERDAEVAAALATLDADRRELLRLRYADELSRAEVAELLGIDEDLVKSRAYEAIEELRRLLRPRG